MNKEGRRFGRLFRQARDLRDVRQCDLEEIAREDDIEIVEFHDPDPGCTACLVPGPFGRGGGLFLQTGQSRGRRRFSIAHELAHYHIPTHSKNGRACEELDLQAREGFRAQVEWEANSFAAELLMPETLFRADARDREVSFETVYELAAPDTYGVSATAAALRLVTLTRESCVLLAIENGRILWQARSEFYLRIGKTGDKIRPGTAAAAVVDGEPPNSRVESVDPYSWIDEKQESDPLLLESTHGIPSLGQVLSLLWIPNQ